MGTKKGQVRKTARRAYTKQRSGPMMLWLGDPMPGEKGYTKFRISTKLKNWFGRWKQCRWIKSKAAIVSVPMLQVKC